MSATYRETRSQTTDMTVKDMYDKINKVLPYGIEGYEIKKKYVDPAKQVKDREYEEALKKPYSQRPKPPRATNRGSFYDEIFKQNKGVPGPDKYKVDKEWVTKEMIEKGKRVGKKLDRITFIDQIFKEGKLRNVPGVGKYNLEKTEEQKKKELDELRKRKIKEADKFSYVDERMYVGTTVPGPGFYNPRDEIPKTKVDPTKPDHWIKKHKAEGKVKKESVPPVGTYKNDFPVEYDTFAKMLALAKDKKDKSAVKYMGLEERFKDPKKSKSLMKVNTPGVGAYPMIAHWPGKEAGKAGATKQKNYMDNLSRGISKSIYY